MPQPTAYTRNYDFTNFQEQFPDQSLPAAPLDANLDLIGISIGQIISRLVLIQRDDGFLRNQSVNVDQLANDVKALLGSPINPRGDWVTLTSYAKLDLVNFNGTTYICAVDHISGVFSTDRDAGKWILFSNPVVDPGSSFFQKFSGNGSNQVFTLSANLGTDEKAILVFYDAGGTKGLDIVDPSTYTLNGTQLTTAFIPANASNNLWVFAPSQLLGAIAQAVADAQAAQAGAEAAEQGAADILADLESDITAIGAQIAAINTVAANIGAVTTVSTNIAGVNTCAANIAAILDAPNQAAIATAQANIATAAAAGIKYKIPVRAATTTTLPACTYANGTAGVGATLTGNVNGALAAVDGTTLALNEDLLVQNQAATLQNGVYRLTQVGTAGTPYILTRRTDFDAWTEIFSAAVPVSEGTVNADRIFICTSNQGGTVGTTGVVFSDFSAAILDGSVSNAKLANMPANSVKANPTAGSAVPQDLTLGASTIPGRSSTGNLTAKVCSDAAFALLDDADFAAMRATLSLDGLGYANRFRNPGFIVAQRPGAALTAGAAAVYTIDGWMMSCAGGNVTWSQSVPVSIGGGVRIGRSLQIQGNTSVSATTLKQRVRDSEHWTLSNRYATFSMWIYNQTGASFTPTLTVRTPTAANNYASTASVLAATNLQACPDAAWTRVSYTLLMSGNGYLGAEYEINFGAALNSNTKYVWVADADVRWTPSTTAGLATVTYDADIPDEGAEWMRSYRYLYTLGGSGGSFGCLGYVCMRAATNIIEMPLQFPVPMHTAPVFSSNLAITNTNPTTNQIVMYINDALSYASFSGAVTFTNGSTGLVGSALFRMTAATSFGGSTGNVGNLYVGPTALLVFSAEL